MNRNTCIRLVSLFLFSCLPFTDAFWGTWNTWSSCTVTCGTGIRSRQRTCMLGQCIGPAEIHQTCLDAECTSNVNELEWSVWGHWSECTKTCGGGSRQRVRTCSTGTESDCCQHSSEESCNLEYTQTRECLNDDCLGVWSYWRPWGGCSADCGDGVQTRTRACEPEDSVCVGGGQQRRSCYVQCPITQELRTGIEDRKSCYEDAGNPCNNGGTCTEDAAGVSCMCQGDWRGPSCNSLCLDSNDRLSCDNKRGIFHDCNDCHRFIICSRTGSLVSIKCTGNRIWTGNGCREASETGVSCIEQNSSKTSLIKLI